MYVHTYPFIMYWPRLFVVIFQEVLEIHPCIKFRLPRLSVSYMHIHMPLEMYWPRVYFEILTMTMFVGSQGFISLPSFVLLSAAVSEIHELNRKKKKEKETNNFENGYFQFNNFPMHVI